MVTLPTPPPCKEKRMTAFLHKMAKAYKQSHDAAGSLQSTMKPIIRKPSCSSLEEELEENHTIGHSENSNPNIITPPLPFLPPPCHTSVSNYKLAYSLSSGAHLNSSIASSRTRSRSRSRSRPISQGSSSFMSSPSQFTSLWDDDAQSAHLDLPPIHPSDYMKTLLCQLAASISAMKTAYAHQQAALNSYKMRGGGDVVSAADTAMVAELDRLSHLHWQLSLLQHMQQDEGECKQTCGADFVVSDEGMIKKEKEDSMMLKRYEGIITRFHDEMSRKEAVAAALKETLAKSMLQGEKLQRRVKALQAQVPIHI